MIVDGLGAAAALVAIISMHAARPVYLAIIGVLSIGRGLIALFT